MLKPATGTCDFFIEIILFFIEYLIEMNYINI